MGKIHEIINRWKVRGFLFDFDGTLVDTIDAYLHTYVELFQEEFNLDIPSKEIIIHFGKPAYQIIQDVLKHELTKEEMDMLIKRREEIFISRHLDKVKLIDGSLDLLRYLKSQAIKLAIVTSSTKSMLVAIASKFSLLNWFDVVITADDVARGKPNPEPFTRAIDLLQLPANSVVAIGDTLYDIISAKRAGIKVIFLTRDIHSNLLGTQERPELIINSFEDLL